MIVHIVFISYAKKEKKQLLETAFKYGARDGNRTRTVSLGS